MMRSIPRNKPRIYTLLIGQRARINKPSSRVMTPDNATQIEGVSRFMLNARMIRMTPEATSDTPSTSVSSVAASSGFSNVTKPATIYSAPSKAQIRNLPQLLI